MKFFQGYTKEKKQPLNESEQWHMPFLIKYVIPCISFIAITFILVYNRNSGISFMQWRANCSQSQGLGSDELGKSNWGWSWKERWIAARPWESRIPSQFTSPKKVQSKQASKAVKTPNPSISVKTTPSSNGKEKTKGRRLSLPAPEKEVAKAQSNRSRRLSFPSSEKLVADEESTKAVEAETKKEELVS